MYPAGSPPKTHWALATATESDRRSFALITSDSGPRRPGALDDTRSAGLRALEGTPYACPARCVARHTDALGVLWHATRVALRVGGHAMRMTQRVVWHAMRMTRRVVWHALRMTRRVGGHGHASDAAL